jgi:hypothetical protein
LATTGRTNDVVKNLAYGIGGVIVGGLLTYFGTRDGDREKRDVVK